MLRLRIRCRGPSLKSVAFVLAVLVIASSSGACGRRPSDGPSARVDALFDKWTAPGSPGCSVTVSRGGALLLSRGYGRANVELDVPMGPSTVLEAASISKPFTALSVMLLAARGQLSLDDEVRKHVPEFRDYGRPLTIRHLLSHTAGLRDVFLLLELSAPEDESRDQNDRLLEVLARQRDLNFPPGEEFQYNNGGYAILAIVVRRVSGQSLAAFAKAHVFDPLGMTSTRFQDDPDALVPNRGSQYHRDGSAWRVVYPTRARGAVGNSGLLTTSTDLVKWAENFSSARVGGARLLAEMQEPAVLNGGERTGWALGLHLPAHGGRRVVGHGGGDRGIDNFVAWYPEHALAIAVLCNSDDVGTLALTQAIADIYLGSETSVAPVRASSPAPPVFPLEQLEPAVGLYREAGGSSFVRVFLRDNELRASLGTGTGDSFRLTPESPVRFLIEGTPFSFEFSPAVTGPATGFQSFSDRTRTGTFDRVEPFAPSMSDLRVYAGAYRSDELGVTWNIEVRGSTLAIRRPARPETVVEPIARDTFTTIGDSMTFERDARGAVRGLALASTGVRRLTFRRVEQ